VTHPFDEGREAREPVTVTDKRRIDPETGQVREAGGQERSDSGSGYGGPERSDSGSGYGGPERSDSGSGSASGAAPQGAAPKAASAGHDDKIAELTADLQRAHADFANYRKRALRDQEAAAERAKAVVLGQLLGVLDDLGRARSHGDLETGPLKSVATSWRRHCPGWDSSSSAWRVRISTRPYTRRSSTKGTDQTPSSGM
jgi:molecular chaperone GrpE